MDPITLDQINAATLIIFLILAIGIILKISSRYLRYRREGLKRPALLKRDLFLWIGLAVPFLGVLIFRTTGAITRESPFYPIWVLSTDALGLAAVIYWAYFEFFLIEREDKNK